MPRAAWIALGMFCVWGSSANTPKDTGTSKDGPSVEIGIGNQAWNNQYPTKNAPLPVTILQSSDDAKHAAERERKSDQNEKESLDTARIAIGVSAVGTAIALGALIFLVKTFKETQAAAIAARDQVVLSNRTFIATHRPRIILREAFLIPSVMGEPVRVSYELANVGGTTATIVKSKFAIFAAPATHIKMQVRYGSESNPGEIDDPIPVFHTLEAGNSYGGMSAAPNTRWISTYKTAPIHGAGSQVNSSSLTFVGRVSYDDDSGVIRHIAFHRRLDPDTRRFLPSDDPQLEYSDDRA